MMGGYQSIRRVLGETSLERKCRLLFGACLVVLVFGTFYYVDRIAERLVLDTTRSKGRDLVDIEMLKRHFEEFYTRDDTVDKAFLQDLINTLENQTYEYDTLALTEESAIASLSAKVPTDPAELEILQLIKKELAEQRNASEGRAPPLESAPNDDAFAEESLATTFSTNDDDGNPVFRDRRLREKDQYIYYQPVSWKESCLRCHTSIAPGALPAAASIAAFDDDARFRVVKVVIPYDQTQQAITWVRATLWGVGIFTVIAAMIALYVVVRYVIVKPLKHLRDVSDDISRGKKETRAEIRTNDEFQELADSFNRMLRHLTDTESDLRKVNSELDGKVDELAQLNMRLHEMNRVKSEFLANMSHELRTPLNSIIGFSEVLQGIDALSDKQKRYAGNIQKSGRLLLEMINDILDLAKMEAGKMDVRLSEFSIASIVGAQCDMVRSLTEEKNIDLEVVAETEAPPLYQDQAKVQQILTNLLSNAIKFTPEGGRITVSARPDVRGRLELVVEDTGVGIAEDDHEIIFEKFRQGPASLGNDNLTREYSGTGLGLSIIKELCKLLGGEVSFTSELGKGSTFTVVLPWTLSAAPAGGSDFSARIDTAAQTVLSEAKPAHQPVSAPADSGSFAAGQQSKAEL